MQLLLDKFPPNLAEGGMGYTWLELSWKAIRQCCPPAKCANHGARVFLFLGICLQDKKKSQMCVQQHIYNDVYCSVGYHNGKLETILMPDYKELVK